MDASNKDKDIAALATGFPQPDQLVAALQEKLCQAIKASVPKSIVHQLELEFRVGSLTSRGNFAPGVNPGTFARLLQVMKQSRSMSIVADAVVSRQTCFKDGTRVEDGVAQRKARKFYHDIRTHASVAHDVRVAMSIEEPAEAPKANPGAAQQHYTIERTKTRSTFTYKMWKYDLTHVKSGRCRGKEADKLDVYEVELELIPVCLDVDRLYGDGDVSTKYIRYVVLSGLLKVKDLLDLCSKALTPSSLKMPRPAPDLNENTHTRRTMSVYRAHLDVPQVLVGGAQQPQPDLLQACSGRVIGNSGITEIREFADGK